MYLFSHLLWFLDLTRTAIVSDLRAQLPKEFLSNTNKHLGNEWGHRYAKHCR